MSRLLERLFPNTIVLQITGLVIISLLLAIAITSWIAWYQFGRSEERENPATTAAEIVTISRLAIDSNSPDELARTVAAGRGVGLDVQVVPLAELVRVEEPSRPPRFLRMLINRMTRQSEIIVLGSMRPSDGERDAIVVKLSEQNSLVFQFPPDPGPPPFFVGPSFILFATSAIFLTLFSIYVLHRITAPLTAFSAAAKAFGESLASDSPLPEKGPREIAQAARALNVMRMKVRALVEERRQMLMAIGHDLRTPVTRLVLYSEQLPPSPTRDKILANLFRIREMLSETLAYSMGHGGMERAEPIDLPSLLMTICAEFTDTVQPVKYAGCDRFAYTCQPRGLVRAITNVVDNATRYGTDVIVSLRTSKFGGVQIDVADDGPGIPYDARDKVFEPFFRADSARSLLQRGGLGLGLTIARDIVRNHGGKIQMLENAPKGLIVRIKLPARGELFEDHNASSHGAPSLPVA